MRGTCADCRFWIRDRSAYAALRRAEPQYGVCELAGSTGGAPDLAGAVAYAIDCEDYGAELLTIGEFGCSRFTAREGGE